MGYESDCLISTNVPFIVSKGFVSILNLKFAKETKAPQAKIRELVLSYCILISSHSRYCLCMPACLVCYSLDRKIYDTVNCRR